MRFKLVTNPSFLVGDLVRVKNMPGDEHFCIIAFKNREHDEPIAVLKGLFNESYIIDKPISQLSSLLVRGKL